MLALVGLIRIAFEDWTPVGWLVMDYRLPVHRDIVLTFLMDYRDKMVEGVL